MTLEQELAATRAELLSVYRDLVQNMRKVRGLESQLLQSENDGVSYRNRIRALEEELRRTAAARRLRLLGIES